MRLLIASLAATMAAALTTPVYAQDATPAPATPAAAATPAPAATPTPAVKPKVGTAAYCNTLKSSTAKSSCLKRVHAQVAAPKTPAAPHEATATTHKAKPKKLTAKPDASAEAVPAAPATPAPSQTINVPPLPQKTI